MDLYGLPGPHVGEPADSDKHAQGVRSQRGLHIVRRYEHRYRYTGQTATGRRRQGDDHGRERAHSPGTAAAAATAPVGGLHGTDASAAATTTAAAAAAASAAAVLSIFGVADGTTVGSATAAAATDRRPGYYVADQSAVRPSEQHGADAEHATGRYSDTHAAGMVSFEILIELLIKVVR